MMIKTNSVLSSTFCSIEYANFFLLIQKILKAEIKFDTPYTILLTYKLDTPCGIRVITAHTSEKMMLTPPPPLSPGNQMIYGGGFGRQVQEGGEK
jgi:hypothetical protein